MRAKRCDRCKKFYEPEAKNERKISLISYSITKSRYSKQVDICPECHNDLVKWFEKGQEVGE